MIKSWAEAKKVDDKIDGTINTNVLSAINSMADEIKRGIVIDVLDEDGYQTNTYKILYTKSQDTKDFSLEIGCLNEIFTECKAWRFN